jgi:ArsR family transcriptional regulator
MDDSPPSVFAHLSALGDSTRSRILALLEQEEMVVSEVCQVLQLPQSTVSRHLRVLVEDGWLATRSEATRRHYRLSPSLPSEARALWGLVRGELGASDWLAGDRERARSVLSRRVERSRAFFSASAGRWDELREELYGTEVEILPLNGLLDAGWSVGDLGTGTGQLAARVAPFVRRVVAVDRSPEMLAAAGRRLAGARNVELVEGDLEALPLADGELDLAVLSLVLHFVPEPLTALREVRRVLAPGGRLLLVDMRAHGREEYRATMGHVWLGFEAAEIERWLGEAGLGETRLTGLPPHPDARGPLLFLASARRAA